ncbi:MULTISPECIES: hypothetical protein [unclassified Corallococcus]|uniref:hypothetical protein n=1 Tax=unclassified Corallococcus TaxID=2685029 RepID=UPI001CBB9754|nr:MULTISPECIES: hypothetical protein [unclassified Corallococcus]MBZ4329512.1 hypothetical protein [Corallococcus sp. AS-1-12]MBZ4374093.1 hypothetical protein [Corallococcus sp. AS-1-6]
MAATDTFPDPPLPELLKRAGLLRRQGRFGSATQLLWARLESNASLIELCRKGSERIAGSEAILAQCDQKLEVARRCLDKPTRRWSFTFWEVLHEVDGLLLLVMPQAMLVPRALEIQQQFERRVTDARAALWLGTDRRNGPLPHCVRRLARLDTDGCCASTSPPLGGEELGYCRHVLRGALDTVNQQVDKTFWQLSINVSLQVFSTLMLLGVFIVSAFLLSQNFVEDWPHTLVRKGLLLIGLAGASGAIASNMLSKERFVVATGATSRYFAYHLMVKPVIGAFAALMLLFLERSRLLLSVETRDASSSADTGSAILHIVVNDNQAAFFTMVALAVVAGWSADRLLGSVMDKVLSKLLGQSEKVLPPPGPPVPPSEPLPEAQ